MTTADPRPAGSGDAAASGRGALYRWGSLVVRRKRMVFVAWALLIGAGLGFLPQFISSLSLAGLWVPSSESSRAASLLARELPGTGSSQLILVFSSRTLGANDPGFRRVVASASRSISALGGVSGIQLPVGPAARVLTAPDGRTAVAVVGLSASESQAERLAPRIVAAAAAAATPSVQVGVTGEPQVAHDVIALIDADLLKTDAVGLPVAVIVLLIVFGSLVAAGLPLLLAVSGLGITFGAFGALSLLMGGGFNSFMESATVALGVGIGIDYALFIVTRFREELAAGAEPAAAAAETMATAGRTVLISGSTVIIALTPLLLVNDPMIREVALGPMLVAAVLVAAALSLLPAALAELGDRINRLVPPLPRWGRRPGSQHAPSRLTALLMRRPLTAVVSIAIPLAMLSAFTLQLSTGLDFGLSAIKDRPAGRADTTLVAAFGPGAISPIQVVFSTRGQKLSARDLQALAELDSQLGRDPRVLAVTSLPSLLGGPAAAAQALTAARTDPALAASLSEVVNAQHGGTLTVTSIVPRASFDSTQATQLVGTLRGELPAALRGTSMHAVVGGTSAAIADLNHEINTKTPLVLGLILGLALLLLSVAFRSLLVALAGLAGTLLSVGAAYGLLVLVFQDGAGQAVFGFHSPGFIQNFLPLLLFAVLVGLSTDYQVFLISRVKEEFEHGGDPARAITVGLERSGRVILSAATVMIIVFASFLLSSELELKELGFALATVVLIDAALTRRILVPATLRLLGTRAWTHLSVQAAPPAKTRAAALP